MTTTEEKWEAEYERWTPRRVKTWVWILVALLILLPLIGWGLSVAFSGVKGAGDVVVERNSAQNRVSSQAYFEDTYQTIIGQDKKLTAARADLNQFLATTPAPSADDVVAAQLYSQQLNSRQTTVTGIQQACVGSVADYNAEARKTLRAEWRSNDLPYQIDNEDPQTDCVG